MEENLLQAVRAHATARPRPFALLFARTDWEENDLAILFLALGSDTLREIAKYLPSQQLVELGLAVSALGEVPWEEVQRVAGKAQALLSTEAPVLTGDKHLALQLMAGALDETQEDVLYRLQATLTPTPFSDILSAVPIKNFSDALLELAIENIALVLSYLTPAQAASVLDSFPRTAQGNSRRTQAVVALLRTKRDDRHARDIELFILKRVAAGTGSQTEGVTHLAAILTALSNDDLTDTLVKQLDKQSPETAEALRAEFSRIHGPSGVRPADDANSAS